MTLTCILLFILGLLVGGIIGLWNVRNADEPVVVVKENKLEGTTSVKEAEKKSENVIQLGAAKDKKDNKKS